jgi:hypothetical protein
VFNGAQAIVRGAQSADLAISLSQAAKLLLLDAEQLVGLVHAMGGDVGSDGGGLSEVQGFIAAFKQPLAVLRRAVGAGVALEAPSLVVVAKQISVQTRDLCKALDGITSHGAGVDSPA